jgi:dihydropteroate synthase
MPEAFHWGTRTYIMGILNATPDSFSNDGLFSAGQGETPSPEETVRRALAQASAFVESGADILDIGGESTRPGSSPVEAPEEKARVLPVIQAIAAKLDTWISVDTYKAEVAEAALQAGAHIVNDVWGLRADPRMAEVVAHHNVPVILMHNRSKPANAEVQERLGGRYVGMQYDNLLEDVKRELMESVQIAHTAGVRDENIILDPGIGFGKTVEQNLTLINNLQEIRALGYPVLLGSSRKSFIGFTLNLPPEQRAEGTAASIAIGIARGADIVRVHDVAMMTHVARMADAMVRRPGKTT